MQASTWIKEAKQGSAAAQKCLFDLFAGRMMVVCRRYLKSAEDAEEVMLDGFYKFFRSISQFQYQDDAALQAWIKRIMINECLMFLRKRSAFVLVSESAAEEVLVPEQAFSALTAAELLLMMVQLPEGYRTVFNLYAIEGYSHAEIASMLGIQEATSRSQLAKARQLLQKMLSLKHQGYEHAQSR